MELDLKTILELKKQGLLNYADYYAKCLSPLEIKDFKRKATDPPNYKPRCKKYGCQKIHRLIENSLFSTFKIKLLVLIEFIRFWAIKDNVTNAVNYLETKNLKVDYHTVGKLFQKIRNICTLSIKKNFGK